MPSSNEITAAVTSYAAWEANDLKTIADSYQDEVVFHHFGRNPLAGTHRGTAAALQRARRQTE